MFPIHDARGNVIGFGGRVIGAGEPKYLNSPETPLFEKGRELYGLFQARRAIRDQQTAIVVEGYMDVVALAQSGVENAVATLGTATTPTHVQKLLRMADNLVFCFDGDKAGRKAAWRALEQSLPVVMDGKDVRFLFLPPEDDPDTFVRRLGKDAFLAELKSAKPLSGFLFDELSSQVDLSSEEGRSRLMMLAKPLLTQITAPALAIMLQRKLADIVGLGAIEVQRLIPIAAAAPSQPPTAGYPAEQPFKQGATGKQRGRFRERFPSKDAGAPVPRFKTAPAGLCAQMIARMLLKPSLAGRFDVEADMSDISATGTAARVAAFIRDHDFEVTPAQVVEHFRDTPDAAEVDRAASHPLLGDMDAEKPEFNIDAEFDEALGRLRAEVAATASREAMLKRARDLGLS